MNIVWKKPDGGVAVTHLLPQVLERMARARLIAGIAADERHPDDQAELDFVIANIGLTEEAHGALIQRRAQIDTNRGMVDARPEVLDYAAVAHRVDYPKDRTYRNAWTWNGTAVTHDMAKAREIHRDALRRVRAPKLVALDVEYQKADEASDTAKKRDIAARKQALRDATKHSAIDAAQTVDELKAAVPAVLS